MDLSLFDPQEYIKQYYNPEDRDFELITFELDKLHNIFSSGKVHGKRLLDLGTGPSIHTVISASRYVEEIYITDYLEENISFLKDWWTTDKILQPKLIEHVLSKEQSSESVKQRSIYIKSKVQDMTHIDVTKSQVLNTKNIPASYDVMTSCGCLDAAVTTKEGYIQCVKNVRPLIVNGGYFLLMGDLSESFYVVGKETFPCIALSGEEIQEIFKCNGFKIISWDESKYRRPLHNGEISDSDGVFVMVAIKCD